MSFRRRLILTLTVIGALAFGSHPVEAHPHVFVDARAEAVFDKDGKLIALRHVWRFDEAFSAFATQGLDTDGNGVLSRAELQPLAKINVDALKDYDYFSYLRVGSKRYGFKIPTEYWLQMDGSLLTLFYTLPLVEPVAIAKQTMTLDVYDPGYFVDFSLVDSEPALLVNAPTGCSLTVDRKGEPDAAAAAVLGQIPASERDLPPELRDMTKDLANRITVKCP